MSAQEDEIEFLHALLQEARDHIGGMPTIDSNGKDQFLSTAMLVRKIELALTDGAPPGATLSPERSGLATGAESTCQKVGGKTI